MSKPSGLRSQADQDAIAATLIPIDQAFRDSEAKWGRGRLPNLVSADTLASYRRGMDAYQGAISSGDVAGLQAVAPKMVAALAFMDAEAVARGHAPLSPVVWETTREDGTVVAVVRTQAEASVVLADGRALEVWTMDEIARVLPPCVGNVKTVFPGARVERATRYSDGFAEDWATSDPLVEYLYPVNA